MAQLTLNINGKAYIIGCEDGQEAHLSQLGADFDAQVRQLAADVGQLGETRLFLMASMMTADEAHEAKHRLGQARAEIARLQSELARLELRAVTALENAAKKVEKLVG